MGLAKLKILSIQMAKILSSDKEKEDKYISFLEKNNLKSGPTPELLASLTKAQRIELANIFQTR